MLIQADHRPEHPVITVSDDYATVLVLEFVLNERIPDRYNPCEAADNQDSSNQYEFYGQYKTPLSVQADPGLWVVFEIWFHNPTL
ncbi:hypothetical protein [Pseudomaricurvus alcaniphilus]|uniref:hypothetical protein n=1 Tax=Pseudomaricurvus alcaniphilus TaxID=1166482 RepID=UPI001FB5BA95|nr:hypothetical protein [Pseudomaricurvus alcaniphilus]